MTHDGSRALVCASFRRNTPRIVRHDPGIRQDTIMFKSNISAISGHIVPCGFIRRQIESDRATARPAGKPGSPASCHGRSLATTRIGRLTPSPFAAVVQNESVELHNERLDDRRLRATKPGRVVFQPPHRLGRQAHRELLFHGASSAALHVAPFSLRHVFHPPRLRGFPTKGDRPRRAVA